MDAVPQQATAVIREGDPSQSNSNKPDVKVNAAESANTNSARGQKSSNDPDKKKTRRKKKTGKKQPGGDKIKKGKKKKHAIPTDDSSDMSEDEGETSSDEDSDATDDTEPEEVPIHKRASKRSIIAQKSKMQKNKAQYSKKRDKHSNSKSISKAPASDTSESDWDSSDSEAEVDAANDTITPPARKKKTKDLSVAEDIRTQVALELQRVLQLAQTRSAIPTYPSLGGGLGGGLDAGLGLAGLNYSRSGRAALDSYPSLERGLGRSNRSHSKDSDDDAGEDPVPSSSRKRGGISQTDKKQRVTGSPDQGKKSKKVDFKRVDQVWDNTIHNFKLQATAESNGEAKYDGFCFHVRRTFDWEGKYKATMVDIKSKSLRECLQDVIGNIKGVSLVDETPKLDPNILFL